MMQRRIEQQYLTLFHHFGDSPVQTTLQVLADVLCCSRRHMRSLLVQMQDLGWIDWQAEAGRGRQSLLHLKCSKPQLLSAKAEKLLEKGQFSQAFDLLGEDKQLIVPLLRAQLGYRIRADFQALRIPYYRTMPNLYPGTPLRRSEMHLVRQIFNGLTRVKEENGEVDADLAHHWRQLDTLHWRFYLRPAVQFHDGHELSSEDVLASLNRCKCLPLFSHLQRVTAAGPLSVDIELSQADARLPLLLSHVDALILPADHADRTSFAACPIGTGPYLVSENDEWHLRLKAFDHYFRLRSLLDEVEVLMWPDLDDAPSSLKEEEKGGVSKQTAAWLSSSTSDADYASGLAAGISGSPSDQSSEMFLERGGYFLLCDSRSPYWRTAGHRRWLRDILGPYVMGQQLIDPIRHFWVPTGSLLPDWYHCMLDGERRSPYLDTQGGATLRLAYPGPHPEFPMLLRIMQDLLAAQGVRLEGQELGYEDWAQGKADADLWLGTANFAVPEEWNVGAWLLGSSLLRSSISGGDTQVLKGWETGWRSATLDAEQLMRETTGSGWLQPLFHHWMRLRGPEQARGLHLNNLGWFDFCSTWLAPD